MIQKHYYSIAGQKVLVIQDWEEEISMFEGFGSNEAEEADFTAEIYYDHGIFEKCYGIEYCRIDESGCVFTSSSHSGIRMITKEDGTHALIEGAQHGTDGVMELFLTAFYSFLSKRGGVLAHASLICYRDETLMFVGDSGVGKTTQAELWEKYKGAEILNGDKVLLMKSEKGFEAWGSPWKGSSQYAENKKALLKSIVLLKQAKTNEIKQLTEEEIHAHFFQHVFFPLWDRKCTEEVMKTLDAFLWNIPVFLLSCRADQEAVEITCREIWGAGQK